MKEPATNSSNGETLISRLRKRAEIRRQITTRKSVQEGKPDRIADLLEEAANEIELLQSKFMVSQQTLELIGDNRTRHPETLAKMVANSLRK